MLLLRVKVMFLLDSGLRCATAFGVERLEDQRTTMRYKVNDPESGEDVRRNSAPTSWEQQQQDEKSARAKETRLIIVVGLLAVAVIALVVTLTLQIAVFGGQEYKEMCQSEECVRTAARVIESLNKTVDPCDDFYKFACGGWIARNPIPQSQTSWDQLSLLREELLKNLRILLEEPDHGDDPKSVQMARTFYRTCMDTASVEVLGLEPVYAVFDRLGLPRDLPMDDTRTPDLDYALLAGVLQRNLGLNFLLNFYVSEDVRNTSHNRMMMEQIQSGFSERYLLDPVRFHTELTEYKKYIKSMVALSGGGERSAEFAEEILAFSTAIAKILTTPEERRSVNHLFHDVSVVELQQLTDMYAAQWNWTTYLSGVFNRTNVTISPERDRVIVMDLNYLQKLPQLLAATPRPTLARYAWWSVYSTVAPLTLQRFRDLGFEFSRKVFGLKEKLPRWKGCTGNVNTDFGMALSYVYVRRHFDEESREKALKMLMDVRQAFDSMVSELEWMDVKTRARAHRKLHAMRPFVGFPEWITQPEKLDKFYSNAKVVEGNLFESFLKLTDANVKKSLGALREKPDKNRWITTGTTVNAFYSAILNSVTFPAGILHPPFYGNGLESINYGAMGAIMGHELTHGFDDQGRRYDENGNLQQWWSDETLRHYQDKVECIIRQYSGYHLPELGNNFTVNGINTQGENIADNGGIREAYRAYQKLKSRSPNQQLSLPGLVDYTQDQLFFLGFAQVWCGNQTSGALKSKLVEGVHAPNHFRVIGTLSNNADFAKAWQCPKGSPMNPEHKCILW